MSEPPTLNRVARRMRVFPVVFLVAVIVGAGAISGCTTVPTAELRGQDDPTLSWNGDPATTMAISWFDSPAISAVEWRPGSGDPSASHTSGALREGPATRVFLRGLTPGTTYAYRAVTSDGSAVGKWRTFTTPPASGALTPGEPFEFAIAGDLQPFNEETVRTTTMGLSKVASLDPTFILQMGDVAEVGISRRSYRLAASVLSVAGGAVPIVATAGNHDYYYGLPSARYFKSFFPAPYADAESLKHNTWYSVTVGPVHLAILDTEADKDRFHRQLEWLRSDLAAARASGTPWVFISMHRPIFATATSPDRTQWAYALLPLIAEYGVDAVFWGHDHMYEHYAYQYGANGYVFSSGDPLAAYPTHFFTVGTIGARVDALYPGFFTHRPFVETRDVFNLPSGSAETLEFMQRPWNESQARYLEPGVRYQDPAVYPNAASYFSYPFDTAADARAGRYSSDPERRYCDDAEFFGYTYGETSIHYLWVEIRGDECIVTAHYVDGAPGEQGTVITTPDGDPQTWVLRN